MDMSKAFYLNEIERSGKLSELENIVETAALAENLSHKDYEEIVLASIRKAQEWRGF